MSIEDLYYLTDGEVPLGIDKLFEAREQIRQEAVRLLMYNEKWPCTSEAEDDELEATLKTLREQRVGIDGLIKSWIPGWEYDPSSILREMIRLRLTICDAWDAPICMWECNRDSTYDKWLVCTHEKLDAGKMISGLPVELAVDDLLPGLLKVGLATWEVHFEPDPEHMVLDGEKWELRVESPVGYIVITGENAWPENFEELCEVLEKACDIHKQGGRQVTLEEAFEIASEHKDLCGDYTEYENGWVFDLSHKYDNMIGPWAPVILKEEGKVRRFFNPYTMMVLGEEIGEGTMPGFDEA